MVFFLQIGQLNHLRSIVGALHVVNLEACKVAGDNPTGRHGNRQSGSISAGLLIRRELCAIGLSDLGGQVHVGAFLLDEHFGGSDIAVNEVRAFLFEDGLHRNFKLHHCHGVVNAENGVEEVQPEALGLSLFIAFAGPLLDEGFCRLLLFIDSAHISLVVHG